MWHSILEFWHSSPILQGGSVLGIFSFLAYKFNSIIKLCSNLFKRYCFYSVSFTNQDSFCHYFSDWFATTNYYKKCKSVDIAYFPTTNRSSSDEMEINSVPSLGFHIFWYKKTLLLLYKSRIENNQQIIYQYTIKFLTVNRSKYTKIIKEISNFANIDGEKYIKYFRPKYDSFAKVSIVKRDINNIILPKLDIEFILNDLEEFLNSNPKYEKLGLPYKRGYLLSGDPGNGKTSLILAIASKYNLRVYEFPKSNQDIFDLLMDIKNDKPYILLMEDADVLLPKRDTTKNEMGTIKFNDILKILDGHLSGHNRITFVTTNYKDIIDSAMIRPGRIDCHLKINNPDSDSISQIILKFIPIVDIILCQDFIDFSVKNLVSMATIEAFLLSIGNRCENIYNIDKYKMYIKQVQQNPSHNIKDKP